MSVKMPAPDQSVLDRRDLIVRALRAIVPGEGVIATEAEMRPYEIGCAYRPTASCPWWWCCPTPSIRCAGC